MAFILFADGLASALPLPEEEKAIQSIASYFGDRSHRIEIVNDPQLAEGYLRTDPPDVLVTDLLPHLTVPTDLLELLEHQQPPRKTSLIVLASVAAEVGIMLRLSQRFAHLIDGYLFRPYYRETPPEQRRTYRVYLSFQEQLLVSIGHLLLQKGLATPEVEADH